MESTSKPTIYSGDNREEVDLKLLFHKTSEVFGSIFSGLKKILTSLGNAILRFLIYLRKNLIWLLLGVAIGIGYGFYLRSTYVPIYKTNITLRSNFNSARTVYATVDYFNSLINTNKEELAKLLKVPVDQVAGIKQLEINPAKTELITARLYNNLFLKNERNILLKTDTFWMRVIDYDKFKASLTKFDYPIHELTISSTNPVVFPAVQQAIIEKVSSSESLQQYKSAAIAINNQVVDILYSSIKDLDTLKKVYNQRLANTVYPDLKTGNIIFSDRRIEMQYPELELYDNLLILKDELKQAKEKAAEETEIIQVYSPASPAGQRQDFLKQTILKYGAYGFLAVLGIMILISFYKYLLTEEKRLEAKGRI